MTNSKQACAQAPFLHPRFEAARQRRLNRRDNAKTVMMTILGILMTIGLAWLAAHAI